jgi:exopolysaccharide biosynthesis polyprenyl glycosylphosphotransferase
MYRETLASTGDGKIPHLVRSPVDPSASAGPAGAASGRLGWRLALHDLVALAVAVAIVLGPLPPWDRLAVQGTVVAVTMAALAGQGLYAARVRTGHAVDTAGVVRAVALGAGAGALVAGVGDVELSAARHVGVAVLALALLSVGRSLYSGWLRATRASGRLVRPLVLVGGNDEAAALQQLLRDHPEHGYRVCGVVAPIEQQAVSATTGHLPRWFSFDDAARAVSETRAGGVLVAGTAVSFEHLSRMTDALLAAGVEVQMATGLQGMAPRRLRWQALAHEPVLALEPCRTPSWQLAAKRALDVALASTVLLVTAPVMVAAALAVKVEDGGPVFFGHDRVGRGGRTFRLYKLRTMVPDAELLLDELHGRNERRDGPLFKLESDPRVTRVGRFLRQSSIDELPQLFNVLRGDMSLVGPRPALDREVARFDDEFRSRRYTVRPGVTGLWQAEARDNPAFGPYRRLDLFYVDNWSIGLDLAILWTTAGRVAARTLRAIRRAPAVPNVARLERSTAGTGDS